MSMGINVFENIRSIHEAVCARRDVQDSSPGKGFVTVNKNQWLSKLHLNNLHLKKPQVPSMEYCNFVISLY